MTVLVSWLCLCPCVAPPLAVIFEIISSVLDGWRVVPRLASPTSHPEHWQQIKSVQKMCPNLNQPIIPDFKNNIFLVEQLTLLSDVGEHAMCQSTVLSRAVNETLRRRFTVLGHSPCWKQSMLTANQTTKKLYLLFIFSGNCETSQRSVDSSSVHSPQSVLVRCWLVKYTSNGREEF